MFTHSVKCPHCGKSVTHNWSEYIISSDVVDEWELKLNIPLNVTSLSVQNVTNYLVFLVLYGNIQKVHIITTNYILHQLNNIYI